MASPSLRSGNFQAWFLDAFLHCKSYSGSLVGLLLSIVATFGVFGCARKQPEIRMPARVQMNPDLVRRIRSHGFPKLMNQLQICCPVPKNESLFRETADWDISVLEPQLIRNSAKYLGVAGTIRSRN